MPLLLAIEASGRHCSVALGDGRFVLERTVDRPREHHALVLPLAQELLSEAGIALQALDAIAFGRGPGSFTGVRIAVAFAQGLGFSLDRPLVPVSSLAALALDAHRIAGPADPATHVFATVDAHMGELFCAAFRREGESLQSLGEDRLSRVEGFTLDAGCAPPMTLLAGDAWAVYPQILPAGGRAVPAAIANARCVLELALGVPATARVPAAEAEPAYVRGVSAWKTRAQQGPARG